MKRYLLWTFRCLRGRRCADLIVLPPTDTDGRPAGVTVHVQYDCGGCGTHYHWDERTRKRTRS